MQRVAIARALANNPEIIMADEPTGALDSKTSVQIMELIQEIAKDKLVIMVTHNMEIAQHYANRVVKMLDGKVIEDSNPYHETVLENANYRLKRTAMSFVQAIKLSLNNLKTKLTRTLITAFAGSIGIIGVALVLALSQGLNEQIATLQTGTLSDYPILVSDVVRSFTPQRPADFDGEVTEGEFPTDPVIHITTGATVIDVHTNIFTDEYLAYVENLDSTLYQDITYSYNLTMNILKQTSDNMVTKITNSQIGWASLPNVDEFVLSSYDLLEGTYPQTKNELLLVVNSYNELDSTMITALGLDPNQTLYNFDDFVGMEFKAALNNDYYTQPTGGLYSPVADLLAVYNNPNSIPLEIVGIARIKADANSTVLQRGIIYTPMLMDELLQNAQQSDIALAQLENISNSVLTGLLLTEVTLRTTLRQLGADVTPSGIRIYPVDFNAKEEIKAYLDEYNANILLDSSLTQEEKDDAQVVYTDLAETIFDTIGSFIDAVTWVLVAFSAISLIVSSIMIGIITYVSVLERTKEIGILRSLGARKKDIARVFNAETLIIGFTAGIMGVAVAYLLTFPINFIVAKLVQDITNIAQLSFMTMGILIAISMFLTYISGLIPARIAAKKDPVEALRTE